MTKRPLVAAAAALAFCILLIHPAKAVYSLPVAKWCLCISGGGAFAIKAKQGHPCAIVCKSNDRKPVSQLGLTEFSSSRRIRHPRAIHYRHRQHASPFQYARHWRGHRRTYAMAVPGTDDAWARPVFSAPMRIERRSRSGGNLCTGQGHCATVASWAVDKFQGLVRDLEQMGYAIGSPGCLSGGHMRNSKHHWGGACDLFNQVARNRTALRQPPPHVQIEVARRHGLISGCEWRRSPDCGHFEVSR